MKSLFWNSRLRPRSLLFFIACLAGTNTALADKSPFDVKLSVGSTWQTSNDVQIPNDDLGTRFDLAELTGAGPYPAVRLEAIWNIKQKHSMRVLLAPLSYQETGSLPEDTRFASALFNAGQLVEGEYRFNSWRVGYRYHLRERDKWDAWIGATLKVRDAEIRLTQGDITSSDDNIGLVPLLYLAGEYRLGNNWKLVGDLDGLAGGPGRAIDLGIGLEYAVTGQWRLGAEYRTLEGGADVEDVYNFAWFNSLLVTTSFAF